MLDRLKLRDNIIGILASAVMFLTVDQTLAAGMLFGLAGILLALYLSLRTTVLPIKTKALFEERWSTEEFKTLMAKDPEFKAAVQYCFNLSSEDFLRFSRLLVEYRDEYNQKALKDVSDFFRRTHKD